MGPSLPVMPIYHQFCTNNGIRRTLVAPYHPRSNGEAERFVQSFKNPIRKEKHVGIQKALCQFLLKYRTTDSIQTDVWERGKDTDCTLMT